MTTLVPSSGNPFGGLSTIKPYNGLSGGGGGPTPATSFMDKKLGMLQQNMLDYTSDQVPKVVAPVKPAEVPAPDPSSSQFQVAPEGITALQSMSGFAPAPLKRETIMRDLSIQDPATVSAKAYQMDPAYKAFVDHYQEGGAIQGLPAWAKENFDRFALNTHYLNQIAPGRMTDMQNMTVRTDVAPTPRPKLQGPDLPKGKNILDTTVKQGTDLIAAPVATLALGAKLMMNDVQRMFGGSSKNDRAIIEEHRAMLKDQGSSLTPESALYWMSKEMKFGAGFAKHPAMQAMTGGLGGLGETTALMGMGQPVDGRDFLGQTVAGAAVPVVSNKAAQLAGPAGALGKFVPQGNAGGRITSTALMGGAGGMGGGLTEGVGDMLAGRGDLMDTLYKTGGYGKMGLIMGGVFGGGMEIFKSLPIAAGNVKSNSQNPAAVNRQQALDIDPGADVPLRAGVDPLFVRHAQDSNLDDLLGYQEQINLTRAKMGSFGGTENTKRAVGDKIIGALQKTFQVKEEAGAALGKMRDALSGEQIVPADLVDGDFITMINKIGVAPDVDGNLVDVYGRLTDQEMGTLRFMWDKMDDGAYSRRSLDVLRQNVNDVFNTTPDMKSSVVGKALLTLKNSATKALVGDPALGMKPLVPEEYMREMARFSQAADIVDDATSVFRVAGDKQMSPSQFKATLGDRELRAGEVAGRLLTNTAGRTEPFLDKMETFAHSQGWEWGGNIRNQAQFSRFVERMTGTQQQGSLEGIVKEGADGGLNPSKIAERVMKAVAGQAKSTKHSQLDALDNYVQDLISKKWPGSPEYQAAQQLYAGPKPEQMDDLSQNFASKDPSEYSYSVSKDGQRIPNRGSYAPGEDGNPIPGGDEYFAADPTKGVGGYDPSAMPPESLQNIARGYIDQVSKGMSPDDLSGLEDEVKNFTDGFMQQTGGKGENLDEDFMRGLESLAKKSSPGGGTFYHVTQNADDVLKGGLRRGGGQSADDLISSGEDPEWAKHLSENNFLFDNLDSAKEMAQRTGGKIVQVDLPDDLAGKLQEDYMGDPGAYSLGADVPPEYVKSAADTQRFYHATSGDAADDIAANGFKGDDSVYLAPTEDGARVLARKGGGIKDKSVVAVDLAPDANILENSSPEFDRIAKQVSADIPANDPAYRIAFNKIAKEQGFDAIRRGDMEVEVLSPKKISNVEKLSGRSSNSRIAEPTATLKASGNTRFREMFGKPLEKIPNTKGFVYHATSPENAELILRRGIRPFAGKVFLAPDPDIARSAVSGYTPNAVVLKIPVSAIPKAWSDPNMPAGVPTFYTDVPIHVSKISRLP